MRRRAEKKWSLSKEPELFGSTRSQIWERELRERFDERKRGLMAEAGREGGERGDDGEMMGGERGDDGEREGGEREEKRNEKRADSEGENDICGWKKKEKERRKKGKYIGKRGD